MNNLRTLTYFNIFEKNAAQHGSSCAIHWNGRDTSHAELFSQTARFANGLKQLNLPPGSRIAVLCKNHPIFFHLLGAASALNIVLVLMNRRLTRDEMTHIVSDTTPDIIFCDIEMKALAEQLTQASSSLRHTSGLA